MNYKMYICHTPSRWNCYPNQIWVVLSVISRLAFIMGARLLLN